LEIIMTINIFIKGMLLGLAIAAPVGPIGILCIQRSLRDGWKKGFFSGLGAASADGLLALIAYIGISWLSKALLNNQVWLSTLGSAFLVYLGVKIMRQKPNTSKQKDQSLGLFAAYLTTLLLTLSNPLTILPFTAAISSFSQDLFTQPWLFVPGVFSGSLLWWVFLTGIASRFESIISESTQVWLNRIAGGVILILALSAVVKGLLFG
jgi:threonine/homoserine/homoserine lactone efflux protein